jgi:hypothetical protein
VIGVHVSQLGCRYETTSFLLRGIITDRTQTQELRLWNTEQPSGPGSKRRCIISPSA